jgi:hypothetical protein
VTYPWLSESEMAATRAEYDVGDLLGDEDRAAQRELDAALERDPEFAAWADQRYLERWGVPGRTRQALTRPGPSPRSARTS